MSSQWVWECKLDNKKPLFVYILYQNAALPWYPWHQDWAMYMELKEKWHQTANSNKNKDDEQKFQHQTAQGKRMITLIFRVSPLEVSTKSFVSVTVCRYNPSRKTGMNNQYNFQELLRPDLITHKISGKKNRQHKEMLLNND